MLLASRLPKVSLTTERLLEDLCRSIMRLRQVRIN